MQIIENINRNDLSSLIINSGQSEKSQTMIDFANSIPEIDSILDLKELDTKFYEYFTRDTATKKFESTASEIFERKTYSGCSDIGLSIAPILRYKGVPTIYVESARIDWLKDVEENNDNKEFMRGHIFLEIFLGNKWYLYDPTFRMVYDNYDYNNLCLPRDYYVFAKGMNSFDIGVHSVQDEKNIAIETLKGFELNMYDNPNYPEFSLKEKIKKYNNTSRCK